MKKYLEIICVIMFSIFFIEGCNSNQNNVTKQEINEKHKCKEINKQNLPDIIAISKVGSNYKFYNIEDDYSLKKIDNFKNIIDLKYNNKKDIFVSTIISNNNENSYNKLIIKNKDKSGELKEAYYYADVKMSKNSSKIAYRSFKDKSHTIPEGMQIYDIENMCKIKRHSDVLVSGNIYQWLDDNTLLYYGVIPQVNNSGKIYKYNIKNEKEEVYFDDINDYCKYFFPIGDKGIFVLENFLDSYRFYYYNFKTRQKYFLSELINEIVNIKIDFDRNKVYFIGKINNQNNYYVYQLDLNDLSLFRITYDFPHYVYLNGGLAIDKKGNIFFVGYNDNIMEKDIYLFKIDTNTIMLMSDNPGNYKIFSSNQ